MGPVYLSGILTAWCVAQLALGAFFGFSYLVTRRERDLLIYGGMCLALAYHSASSAQAHVADDIPARLAAITGVVEAAIFAAVLNLHFVLTFVGRARRRDILALYAVALVLEAAVVSGHWWRLDTAQLSPSSAFGLGVKNWRAEPTLIGKLGFVWIGVQLLMAQAALFKGARSGKPEAYLAFAGGVAVVAAAGNDLLLATGRITNTLFVVPHAFMLYAFSVASTLVFRYRRTIEELTRAQGELRSAAERLSASHAELRVVQDELSRKEQLAAVGELAAAIAHEVRNPLAIIGNAVAGLRRPSARDDEREILLGIVTEETERLNHLVTDLLRFARPTRLRRARLDLLELIQETQVPLGESHHVEVHAAEGAQVVWGDASLLRAALDNVIQNATQAMPSGGVISVDVAPARRGAVDGVRITVADQGPGMDAATLARAVDPFFTTRPSGTGLGLPIVQRIVQAHEGELRLESEVARGTRVVIWLPVTPAATDDSPSQIEAPAAR